MKRFCCLAALMLLSSSADAGSFSFVVGGHRIRIEAPRHCHSRSCVSVSIPEIYETRRRREHTDEVDAAPAVPPVPPPVPAPVQASSRPVAPPAGRPAVEPAMSVTPPAPVALAAAATQEAMAPSPRIQPPPSLPPPPAQTGPARIESPQIEAPAEPARQATDAAPKLSPVSSAADDEPADTPLGVWQTEGQKGSVRIEPCGSALCGYVLDPISGGKGEAVLVNMKLKTGSQWSGSVYSHSSSDTYYGSIALQGPNTLRVEACALGRFYCSANNWSRIDVRPDRLISSRQLSPEKRS